MDKTKEAVADLDQAIKLAPGMAFAFFERGAAYHRIDDYDNAIADYTSSIKIDPKEPLAYINRGMAQIFKDRIDDAIVDFDAALKISPDDINALIQRGFAYGLKKRLSAGAWPTSTRRCACRRATHRPVLSRADPWRSEAIPGRAIEDYTQALRTDQKNPRIYASRANALQQPRRIRRGDRRT